MKKLNIIFFNSKPFVVFSACVITLIFCVHSLQAESLPQRGPIPFNSYDINSNGAVSQDEFNTIRGLRMENRAAQGRPVGNMTLEPNFNQFDTDNDGRLNRDELASGQQRQRQKRREMRQGQGMMQGQGWKGGGKRGRNMPKFTDFDGNNDGYLTEQELIEARSMRISSRIQQGYQMRNTGNIVQFQEIDKNSDGKISPEEFSAQQQKHQMNRQRPQ